MTATKPVRAYEVSVVLIKSPEADATVDALLGGGADVEVVDRGPYLHLRSNSDIRIDLNRVSDELGEPITLGRWLVVMSTYTGRVETGDDFFTVTKELG